MSRGYICPACKHKYAALEVTSLLDPRTGLLICEQCDEHPEVQEYDPNADPANGEMNEDQMLKFNNATRDIQDALKLLEPVTIPSLNMDAWLALNVRSAAVLGEDGKPVEDVKNVKVKIGDEGDEKERIEKARLAEAQRWGQPCDREGQALMAGYRTRCPSGLRIRLSRAERRRSGSMRSAESTAAQLPRWDEVEPMEQTEMETSMTITATWTAATKRKTTTWTSQSRLSRPKVKMASRWKRTRKRATNTPMTATRPCRPPPTRQQMAQMARRTEPERSWSWVSVLCGNPGAGLTPSGWCRQAD